MLAAALLLALTPQFPTLDDANFASLRDAIKPSAAELKFEQCDWKPTFWEGVTEAQQKGKPILLWAMNGHPLACT
jgi:hypothetical protein